MQEIRNHSIAGGSVEGAELNREHLDSREKETLLDDLADLIGSADEENFDEAKLDGLLAALEAIEPVENAFDPVASLEMFHQENQESFDTIEAASHTATAISEKKHSGFPFRKTLLIAAAVALVLSISASGLGCDLGDLLARWTSSLFGYSEVKAEYATVGAYPIEKGESKEYESLQAALDDFEVKGKIAPTWMPEGFEPVSVYAKVNSKGVAFYADYASSSGLEYSIKIIEHNSAKQTLLEKDGEHMEVYKAGGIAYYFISDLTLEKVSWINGELECKISGNISHEDIGRIVESIYGE